MEEDNTEEESLFRRFEAWTIEWDLHIWYGFISLMAICVLIFIFSRELGVSERLKDQVTALQLELNKQQMLVLDLKAENEKQRSLYLLTPTTSAPLHDSVDKTASRVSEKIGKVQEILIDKALNQPAKVKTETVSTTVEVKTVVNKELNTMMKDSYCSTVPTATECKK